METLIIIDIDIDIDIDMRNLSNIWASTKKKAGSSLTGERLPMTNIWSIEYSKMSVSKNEVTL